MADNIIKVTVSSSTKKNVTVSSANVGTEITASSDTGKFWAQTSKNWAVSDNIVDNTDYSSKYYANKAKESANIAQSNAGVCGDIYNSVQEVSQTVFDNIDTKSQEAVTNINNAKTEAVDSINSTKSTAISDIEFVVDGEKQEIQGLVDDEKEEIKDLIGTGKDELKEAIGDVKILTTLEIGDIGIAPLGIDETKGKRRYLNGQLIIQEQYVQFTDKVKSAVALYPSLACTESEWQTTATMTVGGQVGKFVIDDEAGTIRLPKIIMPIQGLTDLSKLGEIVEAGLPNIKGQFNSEYGLYGGGGAFYTVEGIKRASATAWNKNTSYVAFDASKSNSTYGNSTTVQQEQIQYPYFIQVATGAETEDNIINEIELNNPFFFGMSQYFESEPNNISWLKSAGQYNAKAVYPDYYDWLLKIYNGVEVVEGVSVKLSTEEYTDYDYVLNTAEETFRLPLLDGSEDTPDYKAYTVLNANSFPFTAPTKGVLYFTIYVGSAATTGRSLKINDNDTIFVSADEILEASVLMDKDDVASYASKSTTFNASVFYQLKGNGSLYFYVGETVQNANLINAGRIEEKIADLIPDNSSLIAGYGMPSDRYIDLTLGASGTTYTAPATGWVLLTKYTGSGQTDGNIVIAVGACEWRTFCTLQGTTAQINVPVAKGQSFKITYNLSGTTGRFRFVYAQGEK